MNETVVYERDGPIAFVTLTRPERLNALNNQVLAALVDVLGNLRDEADLRVVVLRGAGRAFCSGADVNETFDAADYRGYWHGRMGPMQDIARLLHRMEVPVIAQVHGHVIGGGLEIALLADLRIAAEGTRFRLPEIHIGATVTMGGLYNLARVVGPSRAFEILYTSETFGTDDALRFGLVNRVLPGDELATGVHELATAIAASSLLEASLTRRSIYAALDLSFEEALDAEAITGVLSFVTGARVERMHGVARNIGRGVV